MADFSVKELRTKYNVVSFPTDENEFECSVGGALCLEMLSRQQKLTESLNPYASFPSAILLADFWL